MANKKISQLDALGTAPAGTDILPITDVSGTPTTKSVTVANLHSGLQAELTEGAFVDGDKTKLDGIEASADVTDATNVTAAGALMDSEVTNLDQVKAFDSTAYATAAQGTLADSATQPGDLGTAAAKDVGVSNGNVVELDATGLPAVDGSQLLNLPSPDVNTPLTTALRGTDNPHIGAYPNQSFKVTDNPSKSVMVIADADGNLEFVTKDGANVFVNTPSARLALAKGFSIQEDGDEPDIEAVTPSGATYSVISGDSDTKGANGLPIRQGFNLPDIGANPAPILISGGTIA